MSRSTQQTPRTLAVGYIAGAHGLRGTLKVKLHDPDSDVLELGVPLRISRDGASVGTLEVEQVEGVPGKPGLYRVDAAGIHHRDQAEALRGCGLEIDREELPPLEEDEFYLADAVGLPVVRRLDDGSMQDLGVVVALDSNGPQDLFEVEWRGGVRPERWLLPVLPGFVRDVDEHRVLAEVPEGMLPEALESSSR